MSAEVAFATRSWTVGRYRCTMTIQKPRRGAFVHAVIEWDPCQPRRLSDREIGEYRAGRNRVIAELSQQLGLKSAVLEL